jgi:hypothetical protein
MVEYKNQHFVPEFFLKFFSTDDEHVWTFNLDGEHEFEESVSNVCSRNYFYSREHNKEVEQTNSRIEGRQSKALTDLHDGRRYDALKEDHQFWVRQFVTFQLERTRSMKDRHGDNIREFVDQLEDWGLVDPDEEEVGEAVRSSAQDALIGLMDESWEMEVYLRDLEVVVLVNESDSEFVTSDDPIFLHNSYSNAMGSIGLRRVGLEIYLPISRQLTLLFYDPNIYSIPDIDEPIEVGVEAVRSVNGLQQAGANNNLFYARSGLYEDCPEIEAFTITEFDFINQHSSPEAMFRDDI